MATLFSTMLVLLVGMGTVQVKDSNGDAVTDPHLVDQNLSKAEAGMFYLVIYTAMLILCVMTAGIIGRRLGGIYYTMYHFGILVEYRCYEPRDQCYI